MTRTAVQEWRIRKRERVHRRMDRVKKKHRSSLTLKDWRRSAVRVVDCEAPRVDEEVRRYNAVSTHPEYVARTVRSLEDIQLAKDRRVGLVSATSDGRVWSERDDSQEGCLSRWIRHSDIEGRVPAQPLPHTKRLMSVVDGVGGAP